MSQCFLTHRRNSPNVSKIFKFLTLLLHLIYAVSKNLHSISFSWRLTQHLCILNALRCSLVEKYVLFVCLFKFSNFRTSLDIFPQNTVENKTLKYRNGFFSGTELWVIFIFFLFILYSFLPNLKPLYLYNQRNNCFKKRNSDTKTLLAKYLSQDLSGCF